MGVCYFFCFFTILVLFLFLSPEACRHLFQVDSALHLLHPPAPGLESLCVHVLPVFHTWGAIYLEITLCPCNYISCSRCFVNSSSRVVVLMGMQNLKKPCLYAAHSTKDPSNSKGSPTLTAGQLVGHLLATQDEPLSRVIMGEIIGQTLMDKVRMGSQKPH